MSISAKIRIKKTVETEKRIHYNTDIKNGPVTEDDLPKPPNGRRAFFISVDFRNILQNEMGFAKQQVKGTCMLCRLEKQIMDELQKNDSPERMLTDSSGFDSKIGLENDGNAGRS